MGKKKNKQILRPWCWYCEREFEDEKVLMQHQKAKHFKCQMCPRRLNTAGGLAVHIQQVHKLEPENLPRIENALPGRDGYEVEIFGMVGIPAPDIADYKRRKEIELGLSAGSISQPPQKKAKVENKVYSEDDLKAQLEAHKALMGVSSGPEKPPSGESSAVYGAPPQAYVSPPVPATPVAPPAGAMSPAVPLPFPPPGVTPPIPPGVSPPPGVMPPFPPAIPGMPPGPPPPGFPMPPVFPPGGPLPPPGLARPPIPPPAWMPPSGSTLPGAPGFSPVPAAAPAQPPLPPQFVPASQPPSFTPTIPTTQGQYDANAQLRPTQPTLPNPALAQKNPEFKKATELKYQDANFAPEEHRALYFKYYYAKPVENVAPPVEEPRGKKRARAEDFL
ncbi:hypothetical protein AMATHDRAFT_154940 [Amanita thiersii Skay4041]|uniref:C2H2-type domain-containing protein n=1 Tax=Amanita thiersii Skay4041 TaxID=703135 RepID=A0A2A9N934_9AGAR|nr:hypothetical protein AMATHDRAFT_154940 [Amanita thiersii Skay4041]